MLVGLEKNKDQSSILLAFFCRLFCHQYFQTFCSSACFLLWSLSSTVLLGSLVFHSSLRSHSVGSRPPGDESRDAPMSRVVGCCFLILIFILFYLFHSETPGPPLGAETRGGGWGTICLRPRVVTVEVGGGGWQAAWRWRGQCFHPATCLSGSAGRHKPLSLYSVPRRKAAGPVAPCRSCRRTRTGPEPEINAIVLVLLHDRRFWVQCHRNCHSKQIWPNQYSPEATWGLFSFPSDCFKHHYKEIKSQFSVHYNIALTTTRLRDTCNASAYFCIQRFDRPFPSTHFRCYSEQNSCLHYSKSQKLELRELPENFV